MKKEAKKEMNDVEKQAAMRLAAINEYNKQNQGESWIDPARTPTEEEIAEAKTAFEERTKALQEKNDYLIADEANSVRVATFLKNFIEDAEWEGQFWRGVINFSAWITEFLEKANQEPTPLVMDYGPMQFCYIMLTNKRGRGLKEAEEWAKQWDEFIPIVDTFHDHVEYHENEVKEIKKLQTRWGMLAQGYFLTYLEPEKAPVPEEAQSAPEAPAAEETCVQEPEN